MMSAAAPAVAGGNYSSQFSTADVYANSYDKTNLVLLNAADRDPSFAPDLLQEAGRYQEEMVAIQQDAKTLAQQMNSEVRELVWNFELLHQPWFQKFHAMGDENQDFYMEEQYTNADRWAIGQTGRKPYEFNIITPFVDQLRGEQLGQRTDWEAEGANPISDQYAEGATHFLRWVRQAGENQFDQVESDVFRDGIVRNLGVVSVRPDWTNPYGAVRIERNLGREFMWDVHSSTDAHWSSCKYLWRGHYVDRVKLARMFPEWAPEILALAGMITGRQGWETDWTLNRPKIAPLVSSGGYSESFDPQLRTVYGGLVFCREFYHRRYVEKYSLVDGNTGETYYFDSERDASDARQFLAAWWMQSGALQMIGASMPRISQPLRCDMPVIDQYIFAGDQLLRVTTQQIERFPYEPFMPDYYDNTVVSFLQRGKGRQRFINKLIGYMEEIASGTKPQVGINKAHLAGQQSDREIVEKMFKQGVYLFDNETEGFNINNQFTSFNPQQNGQMVMALLGAVKETMTQLYGSATVLGSPDYSGQSGESQMALKSYASTMTQNLFDKLRRTSERVAETALYYGQFLDPTVSMAVRQDSGEVLYKSLDAFGIQRLGDLKFRAKVTEVLAAPSERERRQKYVFDLMGQLGPERASAFEPMIIENSMLPYSQKQIIRQNLAEIDKRQSDLAEREMKQRELDAEVSRQAKIAQQVNKSRELDILAANPAKITASYKIPAGPATTQAVMDHAGIQGAHPAMIEADQANQALLDQDIEDMRIDHYYKNIPQWARASIAKPKPPVASPKDKSARNNKKVEKTS